MSYTEEGVCPDVHDVIIVGAGPCGLAIAARLCEHTPSALFTDEEHQRYHWIKKHTAQTAIKNKKTGQTKPPSQHCRNYSTLVLDSSGHDWMAQWDRFFDTFEISHLRSPMFFHPDPHDRDGLLAFAHEKARECELIEIPGCGGKEVSKHKKKKRTNCRCTKAPVTIDERDRKDYFTPSRSLFKDYCECVIDRYGLRKIFVRQESVRDIDFGIVPRISETDELFTVRTSRRLHFARTVVLAVGAGNAPAIPKSFTPEMNTGACHAMQIRHFPDPSVKAKIRAGKTTNVMVIGGGLTSAQVTDMAIRHAVTKVWHIMRGACKVKPFDVDLDWMGKFKNHEKASFWSADTDEERLEQIKEARGGGSMTPRYNRIVKQHIQKGRVSQHTYTTIQCQEYNSETQTWSITTSPPIPDLPPIDYVYFATGIPSDFRRLEYLQNLTTKLPIDSYGGLPALNDDLMWKDGVPLFMTGRLASLRIGPGAGNLEGARVGAERIAWAIEDVLGRKEGNIGNLSNKDGESHGYRYGAGIESRYESLQTGS
ncbi:hypothetical protein BDV97DRAFT_58611 [Delphinella strobiligena]|nr:hypothetical protein BDV97DRAFT_58611 [Delphinella strobiligena]